MDLTQLEQTLKDALAQVVTEEETLNAAVAAVKAALPAAEDPAWTAVKSALTANGWTAPAPTPPAPTTDTANPPVPAV